jgi:zinc transporter ZupT
MDRLSGLCTSGGVFLLFLARAASRLLDGLLRFTAGVVLPRPGCGWVGWTRVRA